MVCYHSNETSLSVLVHGAIGFSAFYKVNLKILTKSDFRSFLEVKGLKT